MGVMRVMGNLGMLPVPEAVLSDKRSREFLYRDFYNKVQRSELTFMASADKEQLKVVQKAGLGNLPVMILSSREEETEHKDWQKSQDALLQLSTDYSHTNEPLLPCFAPSVAMEFATCCQRIYQ